MTGLAKHLTHAGDAVSGPAGAHVHYAFKQDGDLQDQILRLPRVLGAWRVQS